MIKINLHQPGQLNLNIDFPSEWNELFPEEVMEICKQQLLPADQQEYSRAKLLKFIIDFRTKISKQKLPPRWMNLVDAEQAVMAGYPLLDFIYSENTLTHSAEECIKLPGLIPRKVYGPVNGFEAITCGEFEDAEIFVHKFFENPNGVHLASLASVLWRPKKKGIRIPYIAYNPKTAIYSTYKSERTASRFLKLAPWRLYAIFIWYAGCRNQLPKFFPTVHEGEGSDEPDNLAFTKCIHAAAGPKNGTRQQIRMMNLYELMFDMEQEAVKAKEMKEEIDSMKR